MVSLYMLINSSSTMVYAPTHELFVILARVSISILIRRRFNKLVVLGNFTKYISIKYHKDLEGYY